MYRTLLAVLLFLIALPACAQSRLVTINGTPLNETLLATIESIYGVTVESGAYWYDAATGAWGLAGQPTAGFIQPDLRLGGPLRADASQGQTGVYVNGRNLPMQDLQAFESVTGPIERGRYWIDRYGNAGLEGGPAVVNLKTLAQQQSQASAQGSGGGVQRSWVTGIGSNSSGGSGYVMGKDWSVSW